jgi:hypothetical protein
VKSFEDRWTEIQKDPVKLKRLFTIIWVVAYSMLIIGGLIIIIILLTGM